MSEGGKACRKCMHLNPMGAVKCEACGAELDELVDVVSPAEHKAAEAELGPMPISDPVAPSPQPSQPAPPYGTPHQPQQPYAQPGYAQPQQPYGQSHQPYAQPHQQPYGQPQPPYGTQYGQPPQVHQHVVVVNQTGAQVGAKSKITAAVLAFFLGYLGVHRFYLGHSGTGAVMLVICLVSFPLMIVVIGVFTWLGVLTWALIDFILILTGGLKAADGSELV